MATFRGTSNGGTGGSASSYTIGKPTGVVENDVQFIIISTDGSGKTFTPSGGATWTRLGLHQDITHGDAQSVDFFYQVAGASEPSAYDITSSGSGVSTAVLVSYSGADTTTPIDAYSIVNPDLLTPPSSPVSMTATAITTATDNETLIYLGTTDWNNNGTDVITDPSGYNYRNFKLGTYTNTYAADTVQATAGSTGTPTAIDTFASQRGNYVVALIALKDMASGGFSTTTAWIGT